MDKYTLWSSGDAELDVKYFDDFNKGKLDYISFLSLAFNNVDELDSSMIICEKEFMLDTEGSIVVFFCVDCVFISKKYNSQNLNMDNYLKMYTPVSKKIMNDINHPFYLNNHFNILEFISSDNDLSVNKSYLFNKFNFEQQLEIVRLWNLFYLILNVDININPLNFDICRG